MERLRLVDYMVVADLIMAQAVMGVYALYGELETTILIPQAYLKFK
jgi:hypothetical protein